MKTIIVPADKFNKLQTKLVKFAFERIRDINPYNKSRHVSILTISKDIVEYGLNDEASSYTKRFGYRNIHSEYAAVRKFLGSFHRPEDLQDYNLFNIRIDRHNNVTNARPCRNCQAFLQIFRPKKVFYSDWNGEFQQWQN